MRRLPVIGRIFLIVLALVLGATVRPAEGLIFFEQREPTTAAVLPQLQPDATQMVIDLAGPWEAVGSDDGRKVLTWLPGSFWGTEQEVEYRRMFMIADSLQNLNFQLHMPEVHYHLEAWLNGQMLTSFTGSHLAASCDMPNAQLRFGQQNELVLRVSNRLSATSSLPLAPQLLQPRNYGGVFSGVFLRGVPAWSIEDVRFSRREAGTRGGSQVLMRIARYGEPPARADSGAAETSYEVHVVIRDPSGEIAVESRRPLTDVTGSGELRLSIPLPEFNFDLWSPEHPVLYDLEATLMAESNVLHRMRRAVGFKQLEIRGGDFYLNGNRWSVRGIDYVPERTGSGRALTPRQLENDLQTIKDAGFNVVRVPYSAPPPALIGIADRLGILVLVEAGIDAIPAPFTANQRFRELSEQTFARLIDQHGDNVSVAAWGIGSQMSWDDPVAHEFGVWLRSLVAARDPRPCYVESGDSALLGPADFLLAGRIEDPVQRDQAVPDRIDVPVIVSRVGRAVAEDDPRQSDLASGPATQAAYVQRKIELVKAADHADGYLLHAYADYHIASTLFALPRRSDPFLLAVGLLGIDRSERPALATVRAMATAEQSAAMATEAHSEQRIPVALPTIAIGALLWMLFAMRRNNVFRHNLKRVFFHPHGFHMDLRYRRFLHASQFLLVWLLEALTLALIVASVLFAFRNDLVFDRYLNHFLSAACKVELANLMWDPVRSVAVFTGIFLALSLPMTLLVRLLSVPFRERMDLWQAANYVVWSFAAVLVMMPVSIILSRLLETPPFRTPALILLGLVVVWCVQRLLGALRIGLGTSAWRVYATVFVVTGLLLIGGAAVLNHQFGTFAYMDHFHRVLSAR